MSRYKQILSELKANPSRWLVTGVAGFIGSNILKVLLRANQNVIGLDNYSTGHLRNLKSVESEVSASEWAHFRFIEGDIRNPEVCRSAVGGCHYVLHQAALGSVPRSIENPLLTHQSNVDGFLNMLIAARDEKVRCFVYAASSSTYGDHPALPKLEDNIGKPLSPYAVTKYANELYAEVFSKIYGFRTVGLRYFNVFGPHQDPDGSYAAVIPKWIASMMKGQGISINGDGETSRDFCYVANVVQANILAAIVSESVAIHQVYNVAVGERTSLNDLESMIRRELTLNCPEINVPPPTYVAFRKGDVRHSLASIDKARTMLGYEPTHKISDGLKEAMDWYLNHFSNSKL